MRTEPATGLIIPMKIRSRNARFQTMVTAPGSRTSMAGGTDTMMEDTLLIPGEKINNTWYYFNRDGYMLNGWQQISSSGIILAPTEP